MKSNFHKKTHFKKPLKLVKLATPSVRHIPHAVRRKLSRRKAPAAEALGEALSNLPRITNETVAEHREAVLGSARKYIYPLQHSRGRIIKVSTSLFVAALVLFFVYCGLALYRFQSTSTFLYQVTRVIPFPIAKAGGHYVAYENYLFELRHLTHYFHTQQKEDFSTESGQRHLDAIKLDSMQKVIDDAYIKQLAADNKISVSNREVANQIALVKSQNRLGNTDQMLEDVLKQFWGWSISDFKRELKTQLLAQKVASQLDVTAHARADNALAMLGEGKPFEAVAAELSDDTTTKATGGKYGLPISQTNRDVPPTVVDALFRLQPGQVSPVIDTGYTLEIVKAGTRQDDKVEAAHISFNLQPISSYLQPLKDQHPARRFISVQ